MTQLPPRHGALKTFAAVAEGRAEVWRILAVLVLVVILTDLMQALLAQAVVAIRGPIQGAVTLVNLQLGITESGVTWALWWSLPAILMLDLALRAVTRRGGISLLGALPRLPLDLAAGCLPVVALGLVTLPILAADPAAAPGRSLGAILAWAPLALPGLILTAAWSEMVFRGFLMQQLAVRWQESWIWMGLPAALFAFLQGTPTQAADLGLPSLLWAFAYGMAAADLTARTGSLGAAIGLQVGLQAQSLFLMALTGPMTGLALYTLDLRGPALLPWLAADFLTLFIGWAATRLLLRV